MLELSKLCIQILVLSYKIASKLKKKYLRTYLSLKNIIVGTI